MKIDVIFKLPIRDHKLQIIFNNTTELDEKQVSRQATKFVNIQIWKSKIKFYQHWYKYMIFLAAETTVRLVILIREKYFHKKNKEQ